MTARESAVAAAIAPHLHCYRMHRRANLLQFSCETVVALDSPSPEAAHYAAVLAALDTTPQPLTLATVEAAVRKWVPASEALVEKILAELAGAVVESQPALGDDEACEALADFIAEKRDEYHRVSDDMDSGELARAVLDWLAARAPQPTPPAQAEAVVAVEYGVRNGATDQWFTFSDLAIAKTVAREQRKEVHQRTITTGSWTALAPTATAQVTAARAIADAAAGYDSGT